MAKAVLFISVVLLVIGLGNSRLVRENSSDGVFDGANHVNQSSFLLTGRLTSTVTCVPTYQFLPCTTNIWGQLFLIVVYEYLLFLGEKYVSAGSELIFKILGSGVFGASAFHILGVLPEAVLVLVSGLSTSKETAQEQVVLGMGFLSGSTIILLTLIWGSCVAAGRNDLSNTSTSSSEFRHTSRLSLTRSGVRTDPETSYTARIMILSIIPFIIVQLPKLFNSTSGLRVAIIVSLVFTILLLFVYCFYQIFRPWIQDRRLEYMMHKYVQDKLLQKLLTADGNPNTPLIIELFHKIDKNKDSFISPAEVRTLILGIQFEEVGLNEYDFMEKVMEEFDSSGDTHIDEAEFAKGISKWLSEAKHSVKNRDLPPNFKKSSTQKTGEEQQLLLDHKDKDGVPVINNLWTYCKAALLLLLGTSMLVILAEPLIESVQNFSTSANIPSFFISFILVPLAINYREAVSAISSSKQKTQRSASLTLSEIYGGVFMNNLVGLAIFLALVYVRDLTWDFSAEVLVVLIICIGMGLFTSFCNTFPLWTTIVAYLLYPFSILLVYVLTSIFGWF